MSCLLSEKVRLEQVPLVSDQLKGGLFTGSQDSDGLSPKTWNMEQPPPQAWAQGQPNKAGRGGNRYNRAGPALDPHHITPDFAPCGVAIPPTLELWRRGPRIWVPTITTAMLPSSPRKDRGSKEIRCPFSLLRASTGASDGGAQGWASRAVPQSRQWGDFWNWVQ